MQGQTETSVRHENIYVVRYRPCCTVRQFHGFVYRAVLVLVVEDVQRVGRLWVIILNVAYVLLIAELEAASGLTNIFLIAI